MAMLAELDANDQDGSWGLVTLPDSASSQLPSRGLVMVEGTINGLAFQAPLEPNGKKGQWFKLNKAMQEAASVNIGDSVTLDIEPMNEWPEPELPPDLKEALDDDSEAYELWKDTTTIARWDWIRWLESVKLAETRKKRPEKLVSMLKSGKRRPCCFNRSMATPPRSATPR